MRKSVRLSVERWPLHIPAARSLRQAGRLSFLARSLSLVSWTLSRFQVSEKLILKSVCLTKAAASRQTMLFFLDESTAADFKTTFNKISLCGLQPHAHSLGHLYSTACKPTGSSYQPRDETRRGRT